MRKVDNLTLAAFKRGSCHPVRTSKNTVVEARAVYLHGHRIAWVDENSGALKINLCGWNTVTTRARINALLRGLGFAARVVQRDHAPYIIGNDPDDPNGTFAVEMSARLDETIVR